MRIRNPKTTINKVRAIEQMFVLELVDQILLGLL